MKFRKKPVVVDARQLTPLSIEGIAEWCGGTIKGIKSHQVKLCLDIQTLEGVMRAEMSDWVIKGIAGEFYPCRPDIFAATYESAE